MVIHIKWRNSLLWRFIYTGHVVSGLIHGLQLQHEWARAGSVYNTC